MAWRGHAGHLPRIFLKNLKSFSQFFHLTTLRCHKMEELTDGLTVPERFECFEKARVLPCFASSTLETVPFFS